MIELVYWWRRKHRPVRPALTYWSIPRDPKGYRGKCSCRYVQGIAGGLGATFDRSTCPIHGPTSEGATFEVIK